jgi:hypothetical protein
MANVFIFSLDDEAANAQVGTTIEKGCELEPLLPLIPEETQIENLRRVYPDGKCYVWGVPEKADHFSIWNFMTEGDLVLGYHDRSIVSAAYVLTKINNPPLAARLWGKGSEGPFNLMCFTNEPFTGEVPIVPQMSIYLDRDYRGFTKLDPEKRDNIMRDYGSFETFVRLGLGYDFPFSFRHSE